jgi:integrase
MRQETFSVAEFPNEKALWKHLEPAISNINQGAARPVQAVPTMGDLAEKYMAEYLPKLAKSTRDTDGSMIKVHILPRWKDVKLANLRPAEVETWIEGLTMATISNGRARRTMKQMLDRAMVWEMLPLSMNPMSLVKVRGSSKRKKKPELLTQEQVGSLVEELDEPYATMILVCAGLGLRVSEGLALKWEDFDWQAKTVIIQRAFTHSELKEAKTETSVSTLPVASILVKRLKAHRTRSTEREWVFPSPRTGRPYSADTLLADHIKPVALGKPCAGI